MIEVDDNKTLFDVAGPPELLSEDAFEEGGLDLGHELHPGPFIDLVVHVAVEEIIDFLFVEEVNRFVLVEVPEALLFLEFGEVIEFVEVFGIGIKFVSEPADFFWTGVGELFEGEEGEMQVARKWPQHIIIMIKRQKEMINNKRKGSGTLY